MTTPAKAPPDVKVENHGTIFLFDLLTPAAREWVDANTHEDRQMIGGKLAVGHRYAVDLAEGMTNDGLIVG